MRAASLFVCLAALIAASASLAGLLQAAPEQIAGDAAAGRLDREALFWDSVRDRRDPADFEDYLQRYPQGEFSGLARRRLDELRKPPPAAAPTPEVTAGRGDAFWNAVRDSRNSADFEEYLQRYPEGEFAGLARRRLDELRKPTAVEPKPAATEPRPAAPERPPEIPAGRGDAFWTAIRDSRNAADFGEYLRRYPDGEFAGAARRRLDELRAAASAPAAKAQSDLEPINRDYVAKEAARVRELPDPKAKVVATLKDGETIRVAGKVKGENWYRVDREGLWFGFVASHLLVEAAPYRSRRRQRGASRMPRPPSRCRRRLQCPSPTRCRPALSRSAPRS